MRHKPVDMTKKYRNPSRICLEIASRLPRQWYANSSVDLSIAIWGISHAAAHSPALRRV